jgi:hypothetical protein
MEQESMSNLVNLATYRRKSRKAYLAKYGARLDLFVERFARQNIDVDFRQLADDFVAGRYGTSQEAWDYVHFRETLADALNEAFGQALYQSLRAERWFDYRQITRDEIVERCLSSYIMSRCQYAVT